MTLSYRVLPATDQDLDGQAAYLASRLHAWVENFACSCQTKLALSYKVFKAEAVMERINVRIDDQVKRRLEAEAREKGVKPSDIVRMALDEHLKDSTPQPNARQLARQLGITGSALGLPADLSTNPKYMDGFGE